MVKGKQNNWRVDALKACVTVVIHPHFFDPFRMIALVGAERKLAVAPALETAAVNFVVVAAKQDFALRITAEFAKLFVIVVGQFVPVVTILAAEERVGRIAKKEDIGTVVFLDRCSEIQIVLLDASKTICYKIERFGQPDPLVNASVRFLQAAPTTFALKPRVSCSHRLMGDDQEGPSPIKRIRIVIVKNLQGIEERPLGPRRGHFQLPPQIDPTSPQHSEKVVNVVVKIVEDFQFALRSEQNIRAGPAEDGHMHFLRRKERKQFRHQGRLRADQREQLPDFGFASSEAAIDFPAVRGEPQPIRADERIVGWHDAQVSPIGMRVGRRT